MMRFVVGLLAILVTASPTAAVTFSSHARSIEAVANVSGPDSDTRNTSAPGLWSEIVLADVLIGGGGAAVASAAQNSDISDSMIAMGGSLSAAAISSFPEFPISSASANSQLSANFSVVSPTPYLSALTTTGDTEVGFFFRPAGSGGSFLANGSGILSPGNYELNIIFTLVAASGESLEGNYAYSLSVVPEPSTTFLILIAGPVFTWRRVPHSV